MTKAKSASSDTTIRERNTRQKQAVRAVFENATRPLAIDEVQLQANIGDDAVSIATVYRAIKSLLAEDRITEVELPGRPPLYEISGKDHHHHFSCTACNRVYELQGCVSMDIKMPRGFKMSHHDLTVYGVCATCRKRAAAA